MELSVASTLGLLLLVSISLSRALNITSTSSAVAKPKYLSESVDELVGPKPLTEKAHGTTAASNVTSSAQAKLNVPKLGGNVQTQYYSESGSVAPGPESVSAKSHEIAARKEAPALSTSTDSTEDAVQKEPKRKGKPGLTYDVDDLPRDANGSVIITKEDLAGSGPPFDYVVPIVISMLAIPFLTVIAAFLYKKGRDFWDRRHYRRMDFLIDGMYNE